MSQPGNEPAIPDDIGHADFVALVAHLTATRPGAAEPGHLGPFSREFLRFRHTPSLAFAGAELIALAHEPQSAPSPARAPTLTLSAAFLGLLGAVTPLPAHFAAAAADEDPDEPILRELCDIFHHRLYALHYRLARCHDLLLALTGGERPTWATRLLALTGAQGPDPERALDLARILVYRGRRGPRALLLVLRLELAEWLGDAALGLREATATTLTCRDDQRSALGRSATTLGRDLLLGTTFRVHGPAFAVTVHHLDADQLHAFLPGAPASERLHALLRDHLADAYDYQVELHLRSGQRPTCQLGVSRRGARLGHTTWLKGQTHLPPPLILRHPPPR